MQYMTLNSSCAWTGIANLLEMEGIQKTDRELILRADLPHQFGYLEGSWLTGPMLQGKDWFDLALLPLGYRCD